MNLKTSLDESELSALRDYAAQHGRTWKSDLRHDWERGDVSQPLQSVRNKVGPSRLSQIKINP